MPKYTSVTIIYNPKATGSGKKLATKLADDLAAKQPKLLVQVRPTEYPGHAQELAYQAAGTGNYPLIISASGDGGYHEVVNGLMRAQQEGAKPTAGLLPAGNANDHYRNLHFAEMSQAIVQHTHRLIDVLKFEATVNGQPCVRYAHSYVGFGFSADVARKLNDIHHTFWKEFMVSMQLMYTTHHTHVKINGRVERDYGLIFTNIPTMAKWFTIARHASADDGLFEVTRFRTRTKAGLFTKVLRGATIGFRSAKAVKRYQFETVEPTLVQLDGEVLTVDSDSKVIVSSQHKALRCII